MDRKYKEYYVKWLSGLEQEIEFWRMYIEGKGGIYFSGYEETVSGDRKFELEDDIPSEYYGRDYIFVDVGSGAFSRCGRITDKVKLNALSVDPLAEVYKFLKKENCVDNEIRLETGFVELLNRKFSENTFDMVHMSNSLDHSFDAIYGISQLLYICKIGGRVILRHAENEAEREEYNGLHQWNLSLHNTEGVFMIWRNNEKYNVSELFKEYADIELYPDCVEKGGWVYNKVVMVKKKNIEISDVGYYDSMFQYTYDFLLKLLLQNVKKHDVRKMSYQEKMCKNIIDVYYNPTKFIKKIEHENIQNVDIYGMGAVGKALYRLLEKNGIYVNQIIDRKKIQFDGKTTITLEEYENGENISKIIVTIFNEREQVTDLLSVKADKEKIVCVEEFLENL